MTSAGCWKFHDRAVDPGRLRALSDVCAQRPWLEITRTENHYPDVPEADYALTIEREHSVRTGQGREQGQGLAFPSGFPSRFTVS